MIQGGDYGYEYRYGRTGLHPLVTWTGDMPGTLPMIAGTGEAPCAVIASLFVANVMLLFINIPLVGVFTKILRVPNWALVPGILAVSAVGVYSVHATTFDLMLMAVLGLVGYLLRKQGVPMAPLILGFVLGDLMEQNLRRALSITNGEFGILFESGISKDLWLGALLMVLVPPVIGWLNKRKAHRNQPHLLNSNA